MITKQKILHPELYAKAKKKADQVHARHSAYKSMYIQKVYKDLGGKYATSKKGKNLNQWNKEQWIQVIPFLNDNKKLKCGSSNKVHKVCRPLVRVNSSTPITLPELMEMHPKSKLLRIARKKNKDMDGRVFWKKMIFYPSKGNEHLSA